MAGDKYSAIWVSYSSISDFLKCPRAYYLKNIYRSPDTGHKIKLISPPLALGQIIHEVIDGISLLPTEERFNESLVIRLNRIWPKISGKLGGFDNNEVEQQYKKRGEEMLLRVMNNPGPLKKLAIKIKMDLPYFWLSVKDRLILCGKIDWLEYLRETDTVHIIDFKTSKSDEDPKSLQLSIYYLLASNCQKRKVVKSSYWYIERNNEPTEQKLPSAEEAENKLLDIARQIKLARQLNVFKCPQKTGCSHCRAYESIIRGDTVFVGTNNYNEDIYIMNSSGMPSEDQSIIL